MGCIDNFKKKNHRKKIQKAFSLKNLKRLIGLALTLYKDSSLLLFLIYKNGIYLKY